MGRPAKTLVVRAGNRARLESIARSLSDEQITTLINTALQKKPKSRTRWSRRSLSEK